MAGHVVVPAGRFHELRRRRARHEVEQMLHGHSRREGVAHTRHTQHRNVDVRQLAEEVQVVGMRQDRNRLREVLVDTRELEANPVERAGDSTHRLVGALKDLADDRIDRPRERQQWHQKQRIGEGVCGSVWWPCWPSRCRGHTGSATNRGPSVSGHTQKTQPKSDAANPCMRLLYPKAVRPINDKLRAITIAAIAEAAIVVRSSFTWLPMISRRAVRLTSGINANGIPTDSTTCDTINA